MKTAQTCITNAQQIIAEFADKLTDDGLADLAAVVAMATVYARGERLGTEYPNGYTEWMDACKEAVAALAAAGVEVKREG